MFVSHTLSCLCFTKAHCQYNRPIKWPIRCEGDQALPFCSVTEQERAVTLDGTYSAGVLPSRSSEGSFLIFFTDKVGSGAGRQGSLASGV